MKKDNSEQSLKMKYKMDNDDYQKSYRSASSISRPPNKSNEDIKYVYQKRIMKNSPTEKSSLSPSSRNLRTPLTNALNTTQGRNINSNVGKQNSVKNWTINSNNSLTMFDENSQLPFDPNSDSKLSKLRKAVCKDNPYQSS